VHVRVQSRHDYSPEDPVASAWAKTAAFTKRKLQRYGLLTLGNVAALALILKGMPGHVLWPMLGIPLVISFAGFFTPTIYYGAMLISGWLDKRQYP
jgi:hypothetical protein